MRSENGRRVAPCRAPALARPSRGAGGRSGPQWGPGAGRHLQPQDEVVLQVVAVVGDALLLGAVGRDQLVELLLLLVHHGHVVLQLIDLLRLLLGIVCGPACQARGVLSHGRRGGVICV